MAKQGGGAMKYQEKLPYNYRWFNGVVLHRQAMDTYNRLSDEINRCVAAGYLRSAEDIADERHYFLTSCFIALMPKVSLAPPANAGIPDITYGGM
jgi:hypothetical protein